MQKIASQGIIEQSIKIHSLDLFEKKMRDQNFTIIFKRKKEHLNKYLKNIKKKKKINYFDILFFRKQ